MNENIKYCEKKLREIYPTISEELIGLFARAILLEIATSELKEIKEEEVGLK